MKYILRTLLIFAVAFVVACASSKKKAVSIPDGYQGVYVNDHWEGDNSIFPVNITGLVLKREGKGYVVMLSNITDGEAEEIEELDFTYANAEFIIEFSSRSILRLKKDGTGLSGTMSFDKDVDKIHLKKIK